MNNKRLKSIEKFHDQLLKVVLLKNNFDWRKLVLVLVLVQKLL